MDDMTVPTARSSTRGPGPRTEAGRPRRRPRRGRRRDRGERAAHRVLAVGLGDLRMAAGAGGIPNMAHPRASVLVGRAGLDPTCEPVPGALRQETKAVEEPATAAAPRPGRGSAGFGKSPVAPLVVVSLRGWRMLAAADESGRPGKKAGPVGGVSGPSISRTFPDERPLGPRQQLQELSLPTRRSSRNDFPLIQAVRIPCRKGSAAWPARLLRAPAVETLLKGALLARLSRSKYPVSGPSPSSGRPVPRASELRPSQRDRCRPGRNEAVDRWRTDSCRRRSAGRPAGALPPSP